MYVFFECYGDHRDLHVLTHAFPTRRSSDLPAWRTCCSAARKAGPWFGRRPEAFSPFGRYLLARKRRRCASGPRQGVRRVRRGTMKTRSGWRLRALGALAVAAGLAAAVPAEADDWNIVGLRLGMSVEETKAALKAYDPAITLDEHWQYFAYSDGVNHGLRTEDFIARSEEHTSELQSLMRNSYAVFCLTNKKYPTNTLHCSTPSNTQ